MARTTIPSELVAINAIHGTLIADNAITAVHIATNAVSGTLIADNAVTSTHIAQNHVTGTQIAQNTITVTHIADSAVETAKINNDAVTQAKIADDAVGADQLAANAVVSASIANGTIVAADLADDAVTIAKMAALARGKIIYGDSAGNPAALALGSNGQVLTTDGTDISWGSGFNADAAQTFNDSGAAVDFRIESDDNANMFFVDGSEDKIGIGTASPARTLHVNSADANVASFEGHQGEGVVISSGTDGRIDIIGYDDTATAYNELHIRAHSGNGLHLDTSGNVGIGEVTPEFPLEIGITSSTSQQVGFEITQATASNDCRMRFKNGADSAYCRVGMENSGTFFVEPYSGSAYIKRFAVKNDGNCGIGTTSPDCPLHINGAANSEQLIITGNNNAGRGLSIQTAASGGQQDAAVVYNAQDTESSGVYPIHIFQTAGNERFRIEANGHFTFTGKDANSNQLIFKDSGGTVDGYLYTEAGEIGFLDADGNWTYKATTDTDHRWFVNNSTKGILNGSGVLTVTSVTETSDYRLKDSIYDMTELAVPRINALRPRKFNWRDTGKADEGFIAHELAEKEPQLVHGEKDGEDDQAVAYGRLTTLLVKAIQELSQEKADREQEIALLENRIEAIEQRLI